MHSAYDVLARRLEECACNGAVPDEFGVKELKKLKKVTDNYEVCCFCC